MSTMLSVAHYQPPPWLRNPHLQSMLASSGVRLRRGQQLGHHVAPEIELVAYRSGYQGLLLADRIEITKDIAAFGEMNVLVNGDQVEVVPISTAWRMRCGNIVSTICAATPPIDQPPSSVCRITPSSAMCS